MHSSPIPRRPPLQMGSGVVMDVLQFWFLKEKMLRYGTWVAQVAFWVIVFVAVVTEADAVMVTDAVTVTGAVVGTKLEQMVDRREVLVQSTGQYRFPALHCWGRAG